MGMQISVIAAARGRDCPVFARGPVSDGPSVAATHIPDGSSVAETHSSDKAEGGRRLRFGNAHGKSNNFRTTLATTATTPKAAIDNAI